MIASVDTDQEKVDRSYYIDVKKHLLPVRNIVHWIYSLILGCMFQICDYELIYISILSKVPEHFDFLNVIDLFFKIHFVFNIGFHNQIKNLFMVLKKHIYKIEGDASLLPSLQQIETEMFPIV